MKRARVVVPACFLLGLLRAGLAFDACSPVPASLPGADPAADDLLYASPTRKDHIGRIVAPVMVNGQGPFRFIVDTGASYSTISPALAQSLGLQPTPGSQILLDGITGSARVMSVPIDRLQAGDVVLEGAHLPLVWAPVMGGADGILGVAGLKNERIIVEFARNRVTIERSHSNRIPLGYVKIPASRLKSGLMAIDARVAGVKAQAIVDTGAERSLGNLALRAALSHWQNVAHDTKVYDVYGSTTDIAQGEMDKAPLIALGPVKIADVELVYGDFHIFDIWGMQDRPALIIGMDVLGTVCSLNIDFRSQDLYVETPYFAGPG